MESKEPTILYCRKGEKKLYERIKEEEDLFRDADLKDIFIMAMVKGFLEGKRNKLDKRESGGLIRSSYLDDIDKSIIKSIVVAVEGRLDILLDKKRVYSIAEEFASGGIKLLANEIASGEFGSYKNRLGLKLYEEAKKLKPIKIE